MRCVEVAWTPLGAPVIKILPVCRSRRGLSPSPVVTDRIRHALRVGISQLEFQTFGQPLLESSLQGVVFLVAVGGSSRDLRDAGQLRIPGQVGARRDRAIRM